MANGMSVFTPLIQKQSTGNEVCYSWSQIKEISTEEQKKKRGKEKRKMRLGGEGVEGRKMDKRKKTKIA